MSQEELGELVERVYERYRRPGLSLTIVHQPEVDGEWTEHHFCHGQANVRGSQWSPDTIFAIASTSKHVTTIAVDLLIRDGQKLPNGKTLSWATPVKEVYPNWSIRDEFITERCTLADLASMRSGLPGHDMAIADQTPDELLELLHHLEPSTGLRQTFQYMNSHYVLLAHIIPTLTGQSFDDFCQERIFKPLGMSDTSDAFSLADRTAAEKTGRLADGHKQSMDVKKAAEIWKGLSESQKEGGGEFPDLPDEMFGSRSAFRFFDRGFRKFGPGPGHLLTTPLDMAKWMKELIQPTVLSKETIETITKPHTALTSSGNPAHPEEGHQIYGLGIVASQYRGFNVWSHGGGVPGYITHMMILPQQQLGITFMCDNETYGIPLVKMLAYEAVDRILGLSRIDWKKRAMDEWMGWLGAADADVTRPAAPRPGVQGGIHGQYTNEGYGELLIRPLSDLPDVEAVLPKLQESSPTPIDPEREIWAAEYDKLFVSHIIFQHVDGPKYYFFSFGMFENLDPPSSAGEGPPGKACWGWTKGVAIFTEKGVGMYGQFSRRGEVDEKKTVTEEDPEINSEVWFRKQ